MNPDARPPAAIESPSNPTVRALRELHSRDGRREQGAFLLEGTRLVAEAASASWPLRVALFDEERARTDQALASLVARIPGATPASARAIKQACDTVTPQGIVAAAALPRALVAVDPSEPLVLVMDALADPGNAGALLRSALGAGLRTVLASSGGADLFSPKVVRSGMGAHFHLKLAQDLSWPELLGVLGENRMRVVADARAELPYHRFDWRQVAALVVGGEAHGAGPDALRLAHTRVSISLAGGVESLNAAVAGSIILFEAKRQREAISR